MSSLVMSALLARVGSILLPTALLSFVYGHRGRGEKEGRKEKERKESLVHNTLVGKKKKTLEMRKETEEKEKERERKRDITTTRGLQDAQDV